MINFEPIENLIDAARAVVDGDPQGIERLKEALDEIKAADNDALSNLSAIDAARDEFLAGADDDIAIDDMPLIDIAEDGVWVNAWVFVPDDNLANDG